MKDWNDLLSLKEAAELVGLEESTIRKKILRGELVEGVDCKKFGKQWILTRECLQKMKKGR